MRKPNLVYEKSGLSPTKEDIKTRGEKHFD